MKKTQMSRAGGDGVTAGKAEARGAPAEVWCQTSSGLPPPRAARPHLHVRILFWGPHFIFNLLG